MAVSIHQPDFMPWLGFFSKIYKSDTLVILNHTLNNPRDSNLWCRRVRINAFNKLFWFSVPLVHKNLPKFIPIDEMHVNWDNEIYLQKMLKTFQLSYNKCQFYEQNKDIVLDYFANKESTLSSNNSDFIIKIINMLDLQTDIVFSSNLNIQGNSTELLIEIAKKLDDNVYISGDGAGNYQDLTKFEKNNIEVRFNNFKPKPYYQRGVSEFIPGLSVIDALMNIGIEDTRKLIIND